MSLLLRASAAYVTCDDFLRRRRNRSLTCWFPHPAGRGRRKYTASPRRKF